MPRQGDLTPHEIQVARRIADGKSNADIGAELNMTVEAVKSCIGRIMGKLKLSKRTSVAAYYMNNLLTADQREAWCATDAAQHFMRAVLTLTPQELRVLDALADNPNLSNAEIGDLISLAEETVKTHLTNTVKKCGVTADSTRTHLAVFRAMTRGRVPLQVTTDLTFVALEERVMGLVALGWSNAMIATRLQRADGLAIEESDVAITVAALCRRLGVGRIGLALYALDNVLSATQRAERAARAAELWAELRDTGLLTPRRVKLVMLLADHEHCDKNNVQLGALMNDLSPITVSKYLSDLWGQLGNDRGRLKLAVVAHLVFNP